MNKLLKYSSISLFALYAQASHGGDTMIDHYNYDMVGQNVSKGFEPTSNSVQINGSDIYVSYTTWADTAGSRDDKVVRQLGLDYSSKYGLAMTNRDHIYADWHTIDNNPEDKKFDFDMVLFSFSEAVALTNTKFNYLTGAGNENQLTVVGFDNIDMFRNTGNTYTTWKNFADSDAVTSVTHMNISPNPIKLSKYEVTYPTTLTEAKYWLIGAYNTYFDPTADETSISGSGFKLASLGISRSTPTPATEVSEPGALALMSLGLGVLLYRRKRRV